MKLNKLLYFLLFFLICINTSANDQGFEKWKTVFKKRALKSNISEKLETKKNYLTD